jgi:23S rRNA pseudouridine2605 synthase
LTLLYVSYIIVTHGSRLFQATSQQFDYIIIVKGRSKLKLGKFLAEADIGSRRNCKDLVVSGKVSVNGKIAESAGIQIDTENDLIEIGGKRILYNPNPEKIYILLNKLPGYLSACIDSRGVPTIMELLPHTEERLFPVGRLDKDTEGLLIATNDGDLVYRLTHPKHQVDKTYLAWVEGIPSEKSLKEMRNGIVLDSGLTAPAGAEIVDSPDPTSRRNTDIDKITTCLKIIIHEGKKRQIKRMCFAIGHKVLKLRRIQLGTISLGDLKPGKYRYLTQMEVESLKNISS